MLVLVFLVLCVVITQGVWIMATAAEIKALVEEIKTIAVEVGGDLDEVIEKLNNSGGLSAAEAQEVADSLTTLRDSLRSIGDKVPEPEEPPVG
jgi:predicted PurR-regulated permease PerM